MKYIINERFLNCEKDFLRDENDDFLVAKVSKMLDLASSDIEEMYIKFIHTKDCLSKLQCKCGCGETFDKFPRSLFYALLIVNNFARSSKRGSEETVNELANRINSARRCEAHNRKIKGKPKSMHVFGYALDINKKDVDKESEDRIAQFLEREGYKVIRYNTFFHVDLR